MKLILATALALVAAPAATQVLVDVSGTLDENQEATLFSTSPSITGGRTYEVQVTFDRDTISLGGEAQTFYSFDYRCDGQDCGGNNGFTPWALSATNSRQLVGRFTLVAPYTQGDPANGFFVDYHGDMYGKTYFSGLTADPQQIVAYRFRISAVPELATWAYLMTGFFGVGGLARISRGRDTGRVFA
jgi:hypothetical protein